MRLQRCVVVALLATCVAGVALPLYAQVRRPPVAAGAAENGLPARTEMSFPNERLAMLREKIQNVYIAPDGKPWFFMQATTSAPDLDTVEDLIEREYSQAMPQMHWARPVLFEPDAENPAKVGRVWFAYYGPANTGSGNRYGQMLIGFDGKKWIERNLPENTQINSVPYGASNPNNHSYGQNVSVAGQAFFAGLGIVYNYDGKNWSSRHFGSERGSYAPMLYPEPDGKGLLAKVTSPSGNGHSLWRWRNEKWSKVFGAEEENQRVTIMGLVPDEKGVLLMHSFPNYGYYTVTYVPYDPAPSLSVEKLVEALKDADFAKREEATAALIARGDDVRKEVEAALEASQKQELKYRLEYIKARLTKVAQTSDPYNRTFTVGAFECKQPVFLTNLEDGRALLAARVMTPDDTNRQGIMMLLMREKNGTWRKLLDNEELSNRSSTQYASPLLVDGGKKAWIRGDGYDNQAILVDLEKGGIAAEMPYVGYAQLLGAMPDGKLLLQANNGILVYDHKAPDNRAPLSAKESLRASSYYAWTDDGYLWMVDQNTSGMRYMKDGKWTSHTKAGKMQFRGTVQPGKGGALLLDSSRGWALLTPADAVVNENLEDLIADNPKAFAEAFTGPRMAPRGSHGGGDGVQVQADKDGNIFLFRQRTKELKVFLKDKEKWIEVNEALREAGMKSGQLVSIAGVGDMSKIFVWDSMAYNSDGTSMLGGVVDGALQFEKLPRAPFSSGNRLVYDKENGLWILGNVDTPGRGSDYAAMRITEKGVVETVPQASPIAVDAGGAVWLMPYGGNQKPAVRIWHDGKVTQGPDLDLTRGEMRLSSNAPGSVYLWTPLGLQHYKAPASEPAAYKEAKVYSLDAIPGRPGTLEVLPDGTAVLVTYVRSSGTTLNLIDLLK